ncbi:type II toxin-antitoxin system death-on-curing family toxin [Candidatus Methylomirabilis sp.]|uniref:type II toxin-antitoxin system death-on-curing family toxin n=1 Tax=Candidatus Methylomirabilis sp. TaxID=2032687 RepID=UPI003C7908B9
MRYLTLNEVLEVHRQVMAQSGGAEGLMHLPALESALAQPQMTFDSADLYPTLVDKAAALGYTLIRNHPFLDGNKRTGHAAMEVFLVLNGYEIRASVDEQERVILQVAASEIEREEFTAWLRTNIVAKD